MCVYSCLGIKIIGRDPSDSKVFLWVHEAGTFQWQPHKYGPASQGGAPGPLPVTFSEPVKD